MIRKLLQYDGINFTINIFFTVISPTLKIFISKTKQICNNYILYFNFKNFEIFSPLIYLLISIISNTMWNINISITTVIYFEKMKLLLSNFKM